MSDHSLTNAELTQLANRLRMYLQENTCCPDAAMGVIGILLGGFALDCADHDPAKAAEAIENEARGVVEAIRSGRIQLVRDPKSKHKPH